MKFHTMSKVRAKTKPASPKRMVPEIYVRSDASSGFVFLFLDYRTHTDVVKFSPEQAESLGSLLIDHAASNPKPGKGFVNAKYVVKH